MKTRMKSLPIFIVILLTFVIFNLSFARSSDPFVKVNGQHFEVDGKDYYFLGTNLWYGMNLGALNKYGDRERLVKELDLLQSLGINNLRVLGASEGKTQTNTVNPPVQPQLDEYDEQVLQGLDFLLAEMHKRKMYAVVYVNNYWVWSGGMSQYVSWLVNQPVPNPFLEQFDWTQFMNFSATFYSSLKANESFRKFVKMLINRTNTVNGFKYKDDPTIMSWQLANEPRPGEGEQGKKNFKVFSEWINQTARYIKSLDTNHLVSTGNEGLFGSMQSAELYREIHNYDSIDYMTFHLWVLNWQWYDPLKAGETYPDALEKAARYIQQHIDYANEIGKPLVLEEFGIPRDGHDYSPKAATSARDGYYKFIFDAIYENANSAGPLAGSNFWAWGGYGKARDSKEAIWKLGDDLTGDPPQEPQGRNSVFATDSTTLEILKDFGVKMANIGK